MIEIMTDLESNTFYLQFPYNRQLIEIVKMIDGRKWNPVLKLWEVPASPAYANMIDRTLHDQRYTGDAAFQAMLTKHTEGIAIRHEPTPTFRETCTPCFQHQLLGLDLTLNRDAIYLAWMMGVGKSKTVVDTAGLMRLQRTLILCPKSVVGEWPRQFITHGHTYGIRCIALARDSVDKRTRVAQKALTMGPTALVINYEAAWMEPFGDWALSQQWDLVVCDEATKIKSGKARVSKFVHKLAAKATKRICLSGTPIPNNPLDLWSQCKFLDVGLFGSSFVAFRSRYSIMGGFQNKQVLAFRNLDELNRRFYEIAHRVTKEECLDLPETMDETREIELGADGVRHYKEMEGQFYARVDEGSITLANVLVESVRLQQLTGGVVQYDEKDTTTEIDTSKASALGDIMEDLPQTEPLVVFCRFRPDLDVIHRVAKEHDRVSYEISGRKHQLEEWRSGDPNATVLAVQIQAGGLGIDLTRARYAVYYSQDWSFGVYEQSKSRLHRQGQRNAVTYYHLLALCAGRKTIDHHIYKALAKKGNVATEILTGRPGNP